MRRQAVSPGLPILDLLPRLQTSSRRAHFATAQQPRHTSARLLQSIGSRNPQWKPQVPTNPLAQGAMRFFRGSASRRATHALLNPQVDEDGKEMVLDITPRAAKRLSEIMTKDSNPYLALRIQVEAGGCHGFQYLMKLVTLPNQSLDSSSAAQQTPTEGKEDAATAIRKDDTIFTFAPDEDTGRHTDLTSPKIILDRPSLELLKGSKVDFTVELIGSQFKITDNPLATSSCGCGTSFDIKF